MADQAITALPKKTYSGSSQIASTDYLLGIDSAEGYQMLIQDLGEYIINRVTASLAGSTQTLASAISALNSNNVYVNSVDNVNSNLISHEDTNAIFMKVYSTEITRLLTNNNTLNNASAQIWFTKANNTTFQYVLALLNTDNVYTGIYNPNTSTVNNVNKLPTRAEMDALNSKLTFSRINSGTINDTSEYPQGVYVQYVAGTVTGAPLDSTGVVITFSWADWYVVQLACVGSAMVWRRYSNNAWGNWTAM